MGVFKRIREAVDEMARPTSIAKGPRARRVAATNITSALVVPAVIIFVVIMAIAVEHLVNTAPKA